MLINMNKENVIIIFYYYQEKYFKFKEVEENPPTQQNYTRKIYQTEVERAENFPSGEEKLPPASADPRGFSPSHFYPAASSTFCALHSKFRIPPPLSFLRCPSCYFASPPSLRPLSSRGQLMV